MMPRSRIIMIRSQETLSIELLTSRCQRKRPARCYSAFAKTAPDGGLKLCRFNRTILCLSAPNDGSLH